MQRDCGRVVGERGRLTLYAGFDREMCRLKGFVESWVGEVVEGQVPDKGTSHVFRLVLQTHETEDTRCWSACPSVLFSSVEPLSLGQRTMRASLVVQVSSSVRKAVLFLAPARDARGVGQGRAPGRTYLIQIVMHKSKRMSKVTLVDNEEKHEERSDRHCE